MDLIKAITKWIFSFRKNDWSFSDYPIKTWKNSNTKNIDLKYGAGIVNWIVMVEHGKTREKALENLRKHFQVFKNNNDDLPRPGLKVPLKFAPTNQIDKYENIAVDYFNKVLEMDYYDGFYSDGSILEYFINSSDEEFKKRFKDEIIKRTFNIYKIDISDIYDEPLYKIFEKIQKNI